MSDLLRANAKAGLAAALHHFPNPISDRDADYGAALQEILNAAGAAAARRVISALPWYVPTPLRELPHLAGWLGIDRLWLKDESSRFGLRALKGVGGAYAIYRLLSAKVAEQRAQPDVPVADLLDGRFQDLTSRITVACATTGNHGRSVAWGAKAFGCKCKIYVPLTTSAGRVAALEALGAEVVHIDGNYDRAVQAAEEDARANGWFIISDTSYESHADTPRDVMHGYRVIASEIVEQLAGRVPTHVFVQAGVGGISAAMCAHFWETWGPDRPRFVIVESKEADCLLQSAQQGRLVIVSGALDTRMYGLAAGKPSLIAWEILRHGVDDFLAIDDAHSFRAMRTLAAGAGGDPRIVVGEAGGAGLGALMAILCDPAGADLAEALEIGPESQVLLFGTEGATDPQSYQEIVGVSDDQVRPQHA